MGFKFWFVRMLKVYIGVATLLFIAELFKQKSLQQALIFACTWSLITTAIFISSRLYQSRKGVECTLCNDIPNKSKKNT